MRTRLISKYALIISIIILMQGCMRSYDYDAIITGGTIYDGSGNTPFIADVGIKGDTIAIIGDLNQATSKVHIVATGKAVSPGFINMLSWANESLLIDGRSQSDIRQGVTLEVMGEGNSMGPINDKMRQARIDRQKDIKYDVPWTTLGEYLQHLEDKGVSTNVASFVGATTVRAHEIGYEDRRATAEELARMEHLVRVAMEEGAVGLGSSLPYIPANYADTAELIALARAANEYGGLYISHIRDEGDEVFASLDEFLTISRESGIRAEIYHLKVSQIQNYPKFDEVIRRIEAAREEGLVITADMYNYNASSTGLNINFPAWVQEGGHRAWVERLKDPEVRARMMTEIHLIPPEDLLLTGFRTDSLRYLTGKSLAEVSAMRGTLPRETMMDLIIQDDSRVGTVRFTMLEEHIRRKLALPWVSFCSDGGSYTIAEPFINYQTHPRAYGSFARLLAKYVREEQVIPLEEAVRRLTSFPAQNLRINKRGSLVPGYYADVVIFDPETIQDNATFEKPHQYATGVEHVFVNGVQVIKDGDHLGTMPGRFVKGPGYKESL